MELYSKIAGDVGYVENVLELHDDISILIQEIEVILFTKKHDVIGYKGLGSDLEELIFSLNASAGDVESIVAKQIEDYCPAARRYRVDTTCKFYKGTAEDIAVLDIVIDNRISFGIIIN